MDLPARHATAADWHLRHLRPRKASSCRRGRPTASRSSTSPGRRQAATSSACRPAAAPAADAHRARGLLPRSGVHARRREGGVLRRRRRPTSSIRSCSTRRRPTTNPSDAGGDRRHQPAEHARDPLDAGDRRRVRRWSPRRRAGAAAFRAQRLATRLLHDRPRAAVDHDRRPRSPHAVPGAGRRPRQQPAGGRRDRLSPDGTRAFVNLQGKHYLVTVPRAGRETVEVKHQGRGRRHRRAGQAACRSKAATTCVDARRHRRSRGRGARSSSVRPIDADRAAARPTSSSRCRARGQRAPCCSPAPASSR